MKAPHHQTLSAQARLAHNASPATVCARWEAGHRVDGQQATTIADYQPEHAHCNRSAGAKLGNRQRGRRTSRSW